MNQQALAIPATIANPDQLFGTLERSQVAHLFEERNRQKEVIQKVSKTLRDPGNSAVISYFLEGNMRDDWRASLINSRNIFDFPNAVKALDASYWSRVIAMTDIQEVMPQARKEEWQENIRKMETPEFLPETVIPTMQGLMASRLKFFAEKVDGIFRALSREHVTNSPFAFAKRMIINYVIDTLGFVNTSPAGHIDDLRRVIARFVCGQSAVASPTYYILRSLMDHPGQWHELDGGALKIKIFKKGTAHLEVHPDIAWRLNQVLSTLYPAAIPAEARSPAIREKTVPIIRKMLEPDVLKAIAGIKYNHKFKAFFVGGDVDCDTDKKVEALMRLLGAERVKGLFYTFNYDASDVIGYLSRTGCIPDQKSHQFYETKEFLKNRVADYLDVNPNDACLEPSAGRGALAAILPQESTDCVDISPLFCAILRAKKYTVYEDDFMTWSRRCKTRYDKIAMNPPYTKNQAKAHVVAASRLLAPHGRLVAILPASLNGVELVPGIAHTWSEVYEDQFDGTSVRVVILMLQRNP